MKNNFQNTSVLACGIACTVLAATVFAQNGDAGTGKELYYVHGCYGCHGYNGDTGARNLVGIDSPIVADIDVFLPYLRLRGDYSPLLPSVRMPAFPESSLSDGDARDLFAYIQTFKENAPDVEDIPAFQAILDSAGRQLEN